MGQRYSPTPEEGRYFVAKKDIQIAKGDVRKPGDEVPEAFTWPQRRRDAFQATGQLLYVPHQAPRPPAKTAGGATPVTEKPAASSQPAAVSAHVLASASPKGEAAKAKR